MTLIAQSPNILDPLIKCRYFRRHLTRWKTRCNESLASNSKVVKGGTRHGRR